MMQIGIHGLVFSGTFDAAGLRRAARGAQRAGFDLLEIPLMDPWAIDGHLVHQIVAEHGLAVTGSLGLSAATDISSTDQATVQRGTDLLRHAVDVLHEAGGRQLCGATYSAMQKYAEPLTASGRHHAIAALRQVADHAQAAGVELCLEIVNRYETRFVNTAHDGLELLHQIDHPNVHLQLDTYHMNIEEANLFEPVLDVADALHYVQVGDSQRGYLGTGTVDFKSFFQALRRIGYDHPIVFESFSSAVVSDALSNTLGIWRNLWQDSDDLARHARQFIANALAAAARA